MREDVGRHNAVDKVVGWAPRERRLPLTGHVLLVSGRASFELTQKALDGRASRCSPPSRRPARWPPTWPSEAGMTLVGFLRGDTMNVYTGEHRVALG